MQIKIHFDNLICKKMAKVQIKMIKTLVNLQFLSILIMGDYNEIRVLC